MGGQPSCLEVPIQAFCGSAFPRMKIPEGETKLTPAEKSVIQYWINAGAVTARPEPENVQDARFTEEEVNHWWFKKFAYQPVPERVEGFVSDSPIDSFVREKLTNCQLTPASTAGCGTLIRRLSFDLRGLPPSEEELRSFTENTRQDPWSPLVDQMLASPRFGERWGRHWLDLAGFAESDGGSLNDPERRYAWALSRLCRGESQCQSVHRSVFPGSTRRR